MVVGYAIIGKMNTILNSIVLVVPHPQEQFQQKVIRFTFGQMMSLLTITRKNVADNWCGKHLNMKTHLGNDFHTKVYMRSDSRHT